MVFVRCYAFETNINHLANGAVRMNDSQPNHFALVSDSCLKLRSKWIIREASAIHKELLALDSNGSDASELKAIDFAELESIDLSGIQLLLSLRKQSNRQPIFDFSSNSVAREWLELCDAV